MRISAAVSALALALRSSTSQAFSNPTSSRLHVPRSTLLRDVVTEESAEAVESEPAAPAAVADGFASPPPPKSAVRISKERIEKVTRERPYPLFLAEKTASLLLDPFTKPSKTLPSPLSTAPKENIVVLGTGWGAAAFLKNIDTDKYDVTVIMIKSNTKITAGEHRSVNSGLGIRYEGRGRAGMAEEALHKSPRRRKEAQRSLSHESAPPIKNNRENIRSQKAAKRSTSSNATGPSFDVVAFEQLSGNTHAFSAEAMTNMDPDIAIQKEHRSIQRRRSINDISEPYPESNQSNANAKKTLTSHKNLWNKKHKHNDKAIHDDDDADDDAKSEISQASEISSSSVFTTTCIKLKGYLKNSHNRKSKVKNHDLTSTNLSSAEEDPFNLTENSVITRRKIPKYRSKTSIGSSGSTATTVLSAGNSTSPTRRGSSSSPNLDEGLSASIQSLHIVEEEPSPDTSGSLPPSVYNEGTETALKGPPPPSRNSGVDRATHVFDLPWRDNASDGRLHGHYSGPVDNKLRPHGEGTLVIEGNSFLKFYGRWAKGELVSPLINEDEKREQELANSKERKRKSSKELARKPPNESRRKSSKSRERRTSTRLDCPVRRNSDNSKPNEPVPTDSLTIATCKNDPSPRRRPPKKYSLGDVARTPRHMVIHRSKDKAVHSASLLKKYDQAFIKRSNGLWTCAVLAERALQPTTASSSHWYAKHEIESEKMDLEESMLFVTNEDGATKIVKRRHWARFIRCLRKDDDDK